MWLLGYPELSIIGCQSLLLLLIQPLTLVPVVIDQGTQDACEKAENNVKDMLDKVMQKDAKFGGQDTQTVKYQVRLTCLWSAYFR